MSISIKSAWDYNCLKLAGVVGTGIHLYSLAINTKHFEGIYQDFAEGRVLRGTLKAVVPYILPYAVSFYARRKAKKETAEKIKLLEDKINELEKKP